MMTEGHTLETSGSDMRQRAIVCEAIGGGRPTLR